MGGTWKELGEVPDSDDDGLDSQEYQQNELDTLPLVSDEPLEDPGNDGVWDVPSSSPNTAQTPSKTSQNQERLPNRVEVVLSSARPNGLSPTPDSSLPPAREPHGRNRFDLSEDGETLEELLADLEQDGAPPAWALSSSLRDDDADADELPANLVRSGIAASSQDLSAQARSIPPSSISLPSPSRLVSPPRTQQIAGGADITDPRQVAIRAERALRPRKPIQEHPYLLESAHYNRFMTSHGVKPVRVVSESGVPRKSRREEEKPQDQDFLADDSQDAQREARPEESEASQPGPTFGPFDDRDELAPSPSPRSSPVHRRLPTSSQQSGSDETDYTSLLEEDEFPTLSELVQNQPKAHSSSSKRYFSSRSTSARKRQKIAAPSAQTTSPPPKFKRFDILNPSPSPRVPEPEAQKEDSREREESPTRPVPPTSRSTPLRPSLILSSPPVQAVTRQVVDLTAPTLEHDDDEPANQSDSSSGSSDRAPDRDVVRENGRRIRGVLPASWLRLDQKRGPTGPRKQVQRRSRSPSHEPVARRGVALPRMASPKSFSEPFFIYDDSDDNDDNDDTTSREQGQGSFRAEMAPDLDVFDDDDIPTVVEENIIDKMLPGRKRNTPATGQQSKRRKAPRQPHNQSVATYQKKITKMLPLATTATKSSNSRGHGSKFENKPRTGRNVARSRPPRAATPPLLSIVDLNDKDAPQFVRVAARAARKRSNMGKASPSRKLINLGNRKDNLDALSVLQDWKSGRIRPKVSAPRPKQKRQPLRQLSTNSSQGGTLPKAGPSSAQNRKISGQGFMEGFLASSGDQAPKAPASTTPANVPPKTLMNRARPGLNIRPAQLETTDEERPAAVRFTATKRALDALYKKSRRGSPSTAGTNLERYLDEHQAPASSSASFPETIQVDAHEEPQGVKSRQKSRFRKKAKPRCVDLEAPQFIHANDPLPLPPSISIDAEEVHREEHKVTGLAPYGSQYTQHFDIFPLDAGIFFHESTLIGSGQLKTALDPEIVEKMLQSRSKAFFTFGERSLGWGAWDDVTSSELGILVDSIAEQLLAVNQFDALATNTVEATNFLLRYVMDSLSFPVHVAQRSFVSRSLEVFRAFAGQLETAAASSDSFFVVRRARVRAKVLERFLIVTHLALLVSRRSAAQVSESIRLEDVLKQFGTLLARDLFIIGLDEVRTAYDELQVLANRERGIRNDRVALNCWTTLMRVMEYAKLPRAGFWDLTYSAMGVSEAASSLDAQRIESLWRDMATLLPLSEFDDMGLLMSDMRHVAPLQGWALPQQVLRHVFEAYKMNPRQSPSFNDYCRTLIGRCHYLIQQWDWRRCTGIIGTIFDFFGSQDLAHLRNEEVFKSPRFLEDLAESPFLAIEANDRCFHIFIKTIAVAIRRLHQVGELKDIRNLVARMLPNHDRQYDKEQMIHQRDLAALRNHHDLLCTLFWASPAEFRPAVHLLEKLVAPGSSHKEACLISLRAWSQLARFVVSSGADGGSYQPFMSWHNNVFSQTLDQYLSAASDIQQQLLALSKDSSRNIGQDIVDATISKNKRAAMDVLYFSAKGSLDVLKQAPNLRVAIRCLNTYQLDHIFTKFDFAYREFDWEILLCAVNTVEVYLKYIEKAAEAQYSSNAQTTDPCEVENAVMFLEHRLVGSFCSMTRTIAGIDGEVASRYAPTRALCIEKAMLLSGRIAARFFHSRVVRLSLFFTSGKYGIFDKTPPELSLSQRRHLPLFLSALVQENVFDFGDIRSTILELWMLSVTTPKQSSVHIDCLAKTLKYHNLPYLPSQVMPLSATSDYSANMDFFETAMSYMRGALRSAAAAQRQTTRGEYGKVLQRVMAQMRSDLRNLRSDFVEHPPFVRYVREVISLVKSYGADICPVESFFYQVSREYSPSVEDPQLHTAGIISYGFRLGEGEATAIPGLFYYLYEKFKVALVNDRLGEECGILERSLGNRHILSFVITRMLPAIIRATIRIPQAWPLLDVYGSALRRLLTSPIVPKDVGMDGPDGIIALLGHILTWLATIREQCTHASGLSCEQVYTTLQFATLANALQPVLTEFLFSPGMGTNAALKSIVDTFNKFADVAASHLGEILIGTEEPQYAGGVLARSLLAGIVGNEESASLRVNGAESAPHIDAFSKHIAADVEKNWVVTANRVAIQARAPGHQASTQSGEGSGYGPWMMDELLRGLYGELQRWKAAMGTKDKSARKQAWEAFGGMLF